VSLRRWRPYLRLFRGSGRLLAASLVLSLAQAALLVPVALLLREAFDERIPAGDDGGLVWIGALILALYLGSAAVGLLNRYSVLRVTKAAVTRLRTQLLERLYALPQTFFDRSSHGRLHSVVVQDSERLDVMANALIAQLVPSLVVSVGLLLTLLFLDPLLLAVLLGVVPLLLGIGRWLGGIVRRRTQRWQQEFDAFSTATQLALRTMTLTKIQAAEAHELERRRQGHEALGRAGRDMAWTQTAFVIVQGAVAAASGVVVLVIGGRLVATGDLSLGSLISFYAFVVLLLRQVSIVVGTVPQVIAGRESIARVETILSAPRREPYRGARRIDFGGAVRLDRVSFGYGSGLVLDDVSVELEAGERVAILGPNGAGKSTLVSLLLGLYRPERGRVLADGVPFDELDLPALRRQIGVVLQDSVVFPGTVAQNIAYGRPGATDEEVRRAASLATVDLFVDELPAGYDTEVGEEGVLLSGGQRQRIALARALLATPALVILDEPTTHLDDAAINRLTANLRSLPGAPTLLVISHDLAVARSLDRVLHLRDGRVAEEEGRPRLARTEVIS